VKVGGELVDVVAGMPDEGGEAVSEGVVLAAGDPVGEEGEQFGELDGVAEVEVEVEVSRSTPSASTRRMRPSNSAARSACPRSLAWSRCLVRMGRNWVLVRK
jgi:hypothetical protein